MQLRKLELECYNCNKKILLEMTSEEYSCYLSNGHLEEDSDSYRVFFDMYGWILNPGVYCDNCKYDLEEG